MKGLVIKELLSVKNNARTFLVMLAFYGILFMFMEDSSFFLGVMVLTFSMQIFTSFSYDEHYKWDKYALSLPVSRRDLVKSKYIFGVILIASSSIVSYVLLVLLGNVPADSRPGLVAVSVASSALLYIGIIIPIVYKLGVEKGRIVMVAVFGLSFGSIMILANSGMAPPSEETLIQWIRFLPAVALAVYLISYHISVGIYQRKEL